MSLKDELVEQVGKFFREQWTERDGRVVPDADTVAMANEAVKLEDAVVLYADMSGSTALVNAESWQFAAEVYKAFLYCAARIISSEGGRITAYDGDRIMAVYIGDSPNTSAARTALKINWCRLEIINPLLLKQYPSKEYQLKHVVGIDRSTLRAARTGARGANDLVWVGRAANYAAKLSSLPDTHASRITADVYNRLVDDAKKHNGVSMWEEAQWTDMNNMKIYRSNWKWSL
ncbi:MAG: adenylate/guanylate cyclase domain-containing protein [Kiritimatiellaceae bacterium]|nr:adenylate/guanylate cyclase domain-containing protein [Kiritimatiellaceae bacterium]